MEGVNSSFASFFFETFIANEMVKEWSNLAW